MPVSNYCLSTTQRRYDVRTDVLIFWENILSVDVSCHFYQTSNQILSVEVEQTDSEGCSTVFLHSSLIVSELHIV